MYGAGMTFEAQVLRSWSLTPSAHAIRVTRPDAFEFLPVQFTFLSLETPEGWKLRAMSLASSPTRPHLEYGVRLSQSAWKRTFRDLAEGDTVRVAGPRGHFVLEEKRPAVLAAGGIGITPLKGMAEYHADKGLATPMVLLYSNRTQVEIAFRRELEQLAKDDARLELVHTLTRADGHGWKGRTGRIDETLLTEAAHGLEGPVFYVCGTPGMVEDIGGLLVGMGVPPEDIRAEEFWGY